jgi:hypothetical protein
MSCIQIVVEEVCSKPHCSGDVIPIRYSSGGEEFEYSLRWETGAQKLPWKGAHDRWVSVDEELGRVLLIRVPAGSPICDNRRMQVIRYTMTEEGEE